MANTAELEQTEPEINSELNEDAEFRGSKEDQEDLLLTAQRYLNIFHQIHIFREKKRREFDQQLLDMPQKVRQILAMLPGGRILLEHMEELEEQKGNRDATLLNLINQKSSNADTVSEATSPIAPTVISAPVELSSDFTKALTDSFSAYSQNLQQLNANIQQIAAQQQNIQTGGSVAPGIDIADTISALLKENSQQQMDVLKNFGETLSQSIAASQKEFIATLIDKQKDASPQVQVIGDSQQMDVLKSFGETLSQSIAASQKEFIATLLDKQRNTSPQVIDNSKQQIDALKDFGKTLSQTIMESQKEFIATLLDKQKNNSPQVIDNSKQQIDALKDFGKTLSQTIMESQKEFIATLLDKQKNLQYQLPEKPIEPQRTMTSIAPVEQTKIEVPQITIVAPDTSAVAPTSAQEDDIADKSQKPEKVFETKDKNKNKDKNKDNKSAKNKETETSPKTTEQTPESIVANDKKNNLKDTQVEDSAKKEDKYFEETASANSDAISAVSSLTVNSDNDKKDKNKHKNKNKNKDKKEDKTQEVGVSAVLPTDVSEHHKDKNQTPEDNLVIADFTKETPIDVTIPALNEDLSDDIVPIDESVDIDFDDFFSSAQDNNNDTDDLQSSITPVVADISTDDTQTETSQSDITPAINETPSDEFVADFPVDDLSTAFDIEDEQQTPEFSAQKESIEPEVAPVIEPEVKFANEPVVDNEAENIVENEVAAENDDEPKPISQPVASSRNLDYDNAMLKIKEALNSTDEVSLDDIDVTPVSLSSDNSFSTYSTEEYDDDLAQSFAELSNDTQAPTTDDVSDEEWEYVDEDGNPITPTDDDEWEYVDEDGNPVNPNDDEEWEYVDEDGNPVNPSDDDEWEYVDEDGNTVLP